MFPLARSGSTNAYNATAAQISSFASTAVSSGAYGNVGRNLLHNPMFNVQQGGIGPWGAGAPTTWVYGPDRWRISVAAAGDALSFNIGALNDADRTAIGDEAAVWEMAVTIGGGAGAGNACVGAQAIEGVRRLGGKTVTVSFWAHASTALYLGVSLDQLFGTGGSPSAAVFGTGQRVSVGTSWAHYSLTFAIPSTAGKTLGTNSDDYTQFNLWFSAGSSFATSSGNVGQMAGGMYLWGMQLEIGSVATPLEKIGFADDMTHCLRFYQVGNAGAWGYAAAPAAPFGYIKSLLVPMRAVPIVTLFNQALFNASPVSGVATSEADVQFIADVTAAGDASFSTGYVASAEL